MTPKSKPLAALVAALLFATTACAAPSKPVPVADTSTMTVVVPPKNYTCTVTSIPMTNNAGTAPKTVVAEITVPLLVGDTVILSSKVQSRVLETYNVGTSGYVQLVHPNGAVQPITFESRAMGYNSNINNVKYSISHSVVFYTAVEDGDHTFQHVEWSYSTAYVSGDRVDISYCDQQLVILGAPSV